MSPYNYPKVRVWENDDLILAEGRNVEESLGTTAIDCSDTMRTGLFVFCFLSILL